MLDALNSRQAGGAIAVACPAASSEAVAVPQFWPPSGSYHIAFLDLHLERIPADLGLDPAGLLRLVSLANALRSIQRGDGSYISSEIAQSIVRSSSATLLELAAGARVPALAEFLRSVAANLMHDRCCITHLEQVKPEGCDLVLMCGPLSTWDWKASSALHSVVVGVLDGALTSAFQQMDHQLDKLGRFLGARMESAPLVATKAPAMIAAELLLCGGEADTYPKQFAFFLAGGARAGSQPGDVVLLFTNVYVERFQRLSLPLFEALYAPLGDEHRRRLADPRWLLNWFKGHDVGHFWSFSADRETTLPGPGDNDGAVLHELMADILGYLALLGPWSPTPEPDPTTAGTVFLGEMLRYLRRGIRYFPDSRAAFIELNFLLKHGLASLDRSSLTFSWEPTGLAEGMTRLARLVTHAVLRGEAAPRKEILGVYGPSMNPELVELLDKAFLRTANLPDDVGFRIA